MSDTITEQIIGAAIEVHRILGPGLLESIYEEALCVEFEMRDIRYERQVDANVEYKGRTIKGQRIDLIVEGEVIVELKAVSLMPEVVTAQVLSYLRATGIKRALALNFSEARLVDGIRRISLGEL